MCVALAGCASPPAPELITSLYVAHDLNAQMGTLTFETSTGHVVRMPADDPSQAMVLGETGCAGLRVTDTSFYYFGPKHDDGTCDLLAGTTTLATNLGPGAFDVGATFVVAARARQVVTIPLSGGAPVAVGAAVDPSLYVANVAIDGTNVYDLTHVMSERLDSTCEQRPLDGSPTISDECPGNGDLAVVGGVFYLTARCIQDNTCGSLYTFSLGGTPKVLAHSDTQFIEALHVHGSHLYWAEGQSIIRANLDGGDQTVLTEGSEIVNDLVVDDTDVYFATDIALYRTHN